MTMFLTKKNNDSVVIKCVLELFLQGLKKGKKGQCCDKMCSRAVPAWIKKKAKEKMSELKKAKKKVSEPRFELGTFSV